MKRNKKRIDDSVWFFVFPPVWLYRAYKNDKLDLLPSLKHCLYTSLYLVVIICVLAPSKHEQGQTVSKVIEEHTALTQDPEAAHTPTPSVESATTADITPEPTETPILEITPVPTESPTPTISLEPTESPIITPTPTEVPKEPAYIITDDTQVEKQVENFVGEKVELTDAQKELIRDLWNDTVSDVFENRDNNSSDNLVWVVENGKVYHRNEECSNMVAPYQIPEDQAINDSRTPCKRCY